MIFLHPLFSSRCWWRKKTLAGQGAPHLEPLPLTGNKEAGKVGGAKGSEVRETTPECSKANPKKGREKAQLSPVMTDHVYTLHDLINIKCPSVDE